MNKLILVTGGSKGIGRAIIERFAKEGFDIVTCARNRGDLVTLKKQVESQYEVNIYYKEADLSTKDGRKVFISYVQSLNKDIDVLINNTGSFIPGAISEEEEGTIEKMIETNLYSAYYVTKALINRMMTNRKGYIFNICSTASITPYVNGGSYCISKYAMYGMTKVLREEMKPHQIKVVAVLPGATFTASWEGANIPEERFMKAADVAHMIFSTYGLSDTTVAEEILIRPQLGDL